MTANQIAYARLGEERRHNEAQEYETHRANDLNWQLGVRSQETQKSIAQLNAATTLSKTNIETATSRYNAELNSSTQRYVADRNAETQLQIASINADTNRYVANVQANTSRYVAETNAAASRYSADKANEASRFATANKWATDRAALNETVRHNLQTEEVSRSKTGIDVASGIVNSAVNIGKILLPFLA